MIRVGFDAKRFFQNSTGLGNYSRGVIQSLATTASQELEIHLFTPSRSQDVPLPPGAITHAPTTPIERLGWRELKIPSLCREFQIDLFHGLSAELPIGIEKAVKASVVTIHDLVAVHSPELFPWFDAKVYQTKMQSAVRRADLILATSEATRQDVLETYRVASDRVKVLYQSPSPEYFQSVPPIQIEQVRKRYGIPEHYWLSVGSIIPRKRLRATLLAYSLAWKNRSDLPPLVVIGNDQTPYATQAKEDIARLGLNSQVVWLGKVPAADLPLLTQGALASLYPSVFEGFGIPIAEAHLLGVPVITSKFSCLPEVAGPGALCVDPDHTEEYAGAIEKLYRDSTLRQQLGEAGKERAHRVFHPSALSAQLLAHYRSLLAIG